MDRVLPAFGRIDCDDSGGETELAEKFRETPTFQVTAQQ
jgi:hypothetical protein